MPIDVPRIAAVGFVSCNFSSFTTSATSSFLLLTPVRANRCPILPRHSSRSHRRPHQPLVFEIEAISTTPSPSDNNNSDNNSSDENDQSENQPPPSSAQTFLDQLNSSELNKQFDEKQPTELGLRVSQSQGIIDFFFNYLTKGLTEDVDQYLSSPFRLVSIAAVVLLFGFFAATSATTIIGSVADWDPLAAAVLLILTEGFTKYYYTRPNNSRLVQLVNAFKIGLIYASSSSAGRNSNQRSEGHKREREHDQGDNDDDDDDDTEIQQQQKKQHRSERNGKFELSEKDRNLQLAYGSDLIRESGLSLRLAHSSISFAQHLMHRFYKAHSLLDECMIWVCGASLLLSVKCHHHHKHFNDSRTIHHISASLYNRLHDREQSTEVLLNFYGSQGYEWRTAIIATERRILIAIGFHLFNDLRPHHFLVFFIDKLQQHSVATSWTSSPPSPIFQRLLQCAWNFTNDCFLSDLCVFHPPEAVACACIVVALEKCQLRLPQGWQIVFGSSTDQCQRISELIKQVYQLGPLRGAYVDYSRTDAFSQFHPKPILK